MFQFKIFEHLNESDVIPFTMSSTQASGAKRIESLVDNDSNLPPGALLQRRCRMFHERSQCPGHSHTLRGCRGCIPCDTSSRSSRRCCWTCAGSCWTLPRGISPCSDSCLSHTWRNDCFHILHHYHMCPPPLIWRNLNNFIFNLIKPLQGDWAEHLCWQQSSFRSQSPPCLLQLLDPHTRAPSQSWSWLQSPSPRPHIFTSFLTQQCSPPRHFISSSSTLSSSTMILRAVSPGSGSSRNVSLASLHVDPEWWYALQFPVELNSLWQNWAHWSSPENKQTLPGDRSC